MTDPRTRYRSLFSALTLALAILGTARAEVISLNFIRADDGTGTLTDVDVAGVVPSGNWNNPTTENADAEPVGITLNDETGSATTAVATWASGASSWSLPLTGAGDPGDTLMMTGYLDQDTNGSGQVHTITITDIPYSNYDVYLYHSSHRGPNRTARYTANGTDIFTRNLDPADVFDGFIQSGYPTLAEAADLLNPAGNYVRWEGFSSATITIEGEGLGDPDGGAGGNTRRAPIQGIQIVDLDTGLPGIENLPATAVGVNSATANGNLVDNGAGADPADITIYWGTTDGGDDAGAWDDSTSAGTLVAPGTFNATLSGLAGNTAYFYRCFASNSAGDDWAPSSVTFTTLPTPEFPEVENRPATMVGLDIGTANGELLKNGAGAEPADLAIYWGTSDGGTDPVAWENSTSAGTLTAPGTFSVELSGLDQNTIYYYRAFASNSSGTDWADASASFATLLPPIDAIGLNFVRGDNGATPLDPTDIAGVVPASRWNNSTQANANAGSDFPLVDDTGNPTGATATWMSGGGSWSVTTAGAGSAGDKKLMTGYLDQLLDGNDQIHMLTINDIPYPTYDVYLYHSSSGRPNSTARFRANGTDWFTRNLDPANTFDAFVNAQYPTLAEAALGGGNPAGNYVVWEDLSGTLTIEAQGLGDDDGGSGGNIRRAPIQGIQIVSASPATPFAITSIEHDTESGIVTITWNSEPGANYAISASGSMDAVGNPGGWLELDDFEATEASSSYEHTLPDPAPVRLFYIVARLPD